MDTLMLLSTGIGLFLFFALQMILFRTRDEAYVPQSIIYALAVGFIGLCFCDIVYFHNITLTGLSALLYLAASTWYLFIPFSVFESSVTVRLLREIAGAGNKGITRDALWLKYSTSTIVKERLDRLVASGEIKKAGNAYWRTPRHSVFAGREYLSVIFRRLFPTKP